MTKILVATELKVTKSYALLQLLPVSCTQGDFIHLLFKLVKSFLKEEDLWTKIGVELDI